MDRCGISAVPDRRDRDKPFPELTAALDGLRNAGCKPAALSNGSRNTPRRRLVPDPCRLQARAKAEERKSKSDRASPRIDPLRR
jgi:hypothetical protein